MPRFEDVRVGQQLPTSEHTLDQERLIRYAGASGDFNRLHWDPEFAERVSPTKGVIAHGMLNMGLVSAAVSKWAGAPDRVKRLSSSFRAPCPVGATVTVSGEVVALNPADRTAEVAVWVELADGSKVIDRRSSRAVVQLD